MEDDGMLYALKRNVVLVSLDSISAFQVFVLLTLSLTLLLFLFPSEEVLLLGFCGWLGECFGCPACESFFNASE